MEENNKNNQNTGKQSNSKDTARWWEFYMIRYLIGTLIGTIVLYMLFSNFSKRGIPDSTYKEILENILCLDDTTDLIILIVGGLAISYIASSPILILHAIRLRLKPKKKRLNSKDRRKIRTIPVKSGIAFFLLGSILSLISTYYFFISIETGIISILVIVPFGLLLYNWISEYGDEQKIKHAYYEIVKAREVNQYKEYTESYRHLREHGNAFFILFTEILLGLALYPVHKPYDVLAVLAVWIVPPVLIWFFANYLEGYLLEINKPTEEENNPLP